MHDLDAALFHAVYDGTPSALALRVMLVLTFLGGGWGLAVFAPLLAWAPARRTLGAFAATIACNTVFVFAIKAIVRRARPCVALPGVEARCDIPADFSFPSGHAAGSFAFACFVATILVAAARNEGLAVRARAFAAFFAGLAVLLAVGVAVSRVYLGVHFPVDVTVGAAVGATFGTVGALRHLRARAAKAGVPSLPPPALESSLGMQPLPSAGIVPADDD